MTRNMDPQAVIQRLADALRARTLAAREAAERAAALEKLVATRTAELDGVRLQDKLRLGQLEAEVSRRTAELRRAATHDELTGLPNRALLHDRLIQALELSRRHAELHVALLFVDLDRFKLVNDSLGHAAGDHLLQIISGRLASVLRNTDTVAVGEGNTSTAARLGGDEFCILLTGLRKPEEAAAVAQRILDALELPYDLDGHLVQCSASIGIACSATGYQQASDMVRDADNAMYSAKAAGKGRYVIFDRAMHEHAIARLRVEADLRRSIELQQLGCFFQPIVSLVTGEIVGVEALARWNHPTRGMIAPADFLPIAEETGFIHALGLWVLRDACGHVARWRRLAGRCNLTLSINVSPRQLAAPNFPADVASILAAAGLPPRALILELTETALVSNTAARETLLCFREMGVRVYLDNFGTGHSPLTLLHALPLDGLKVDRTFVAHAAEGRRFAAIVQALMQLVSNLGMAAIAEGVESIEQIALLQSLACPTAQGYLFSPPQPADSITAMLTSHKRFWGMVVEPAA